MTEEMTALARRAVACKGWRWMPGMLTISDGRMSDEGWPAYVVRDYGSCGVAECVNWRINPKNGALPDLTDPATLGCLLALVREAWGDVYMRPERWLSCSDDWTLRHYQTRENMVWFYGDEWTASEEYKVLVLALEDAPCGR